MQTLSLGSLRQLQPSRWLIEVSYHWISIAAATNSGPARIGTATVAGLVVSITQDAAPCSYAISPASQTVVHDGGTVTTTLTTASHCTWSAAANDPWLTINGAASGSGGATISLTASANNGDARTGTATIAGQTFTVNQAAAAPAPCTFSISPASQNVVASGGSGSVAVTASAPTCSWTAASNAGWVTIASGASGTGSGTVGLSYAANAGDVRSGTVTIAGQTFTASQAAAACSFVASASPVAAASWASSTWTRACQIGASSRTLRSKAALRYRRASS